jgi:hypothetical protein
MSPRKLSHAESREIERQIRAETEADSRPELIWMETEEIGAGYGFTAWCGLAVAVVIALVVTLSLVAS